MMPGLKGTITLSPVRGPLSRLICDPRGRDTNASDAALSRQPECASKPRAISPLRAPVACAMCGEPVNKRRRQHCDACTPSARREHGPRAMEVARKALAAQATAGKDPRRSAAVNGARGEAISDGYRRNRNWAREHPGQLDEAWFKREITEARRVLAQGNRSGDGAIPRGLLARTLRCEGTASEALGGFGGSDPRLKSKATRRTPFGL